MYPRHLKPLISNSFFLFGPRGSGKTTLLKELFAGHNALWIDLLDAKLADTYLLSTETLKHEIAANENLEWVIIDEIQKIPALLDVVHQLIESTNLKFALTGSSARKLKRGGANLLAGRAFVYNLHPFTYTELSSHFSLEEALNWGTLPKLFELTIPEEKERFLESYCHTYLKEEVVAEQLVRNVRPFRKFLEMAATQDGKVVNYAKIARDIGVNDKTVATYFEIMEETLVALRLPAYHKSLRKQYIKSPKFYLFDCGVSRALANLLHIPEAPGTYSYGRRFEQFIILEIHRLNEYFRTKYALSYFMSNDGAEIDLILSRPGSAEIFIEIKSADRVDASMLSNMRRFLKDDLHAKGYCLSRVPTALDIDGIRVLPWKQGIMEILGIGLDRDV